MSADAEPGLVAEHAGEAIGRGYELQPVGFQFICIFSVEGRPCEQAQIHRTEIMTEAGQRVFGRPHGPADRRIALENRYFPAFRRQMRGTGQTVVACSDQNGVELAHAPPVKIPLGLKIIADAYVFV